MDGVAVALGDAAVAVVVVVVVVGGERPGLAWPPASARH